MCFPLNFLNVSENVIYRTLYSDCFWKKNLKYLEIQEGLRSENRTKYYLCKGICVYIFSNPERYITSTK